MGLNLRLLLCLSFGWGSLGCAPPERERQAEGGAELEIVAQNLQVPWDIAFAGWDLYFTERAGRLSVLRKGEKKPLLLQKFSGMPTEGEGGLMGLAFHPHFETNRYLYISYTYKTESGGLKNRIERYTVDGEKPIQPKVICDNLPGGWVHNGCRLGFGPDAKLYATTGDAGQKEIAQHLTSLGGKLLRMNADGSVPGDNPFPDSLVYSYGHRNGQGLDWHPVTKELYEAEHGPSGGDAPGGGDEINIVERGKNYGWPIIHHREKRDRMESPLLEFTPAIAPSGACFCTSNKFPQYRNNLFVATLRGKHLMRIIWDGKNPRKAKKIEKLFLNNLGRLRDVEQGPDGFL